jgi:hypothetical protein
MPVLSLTEFSPISVDLEDHLFVSFKGYFDGGNEADSREYRIVTLAAFSGSGAMWDHFTEQWDRVLTTHRAKFLHTTDAVALRNEFAVSKGWNRESVDLFISECVSVIEKCATTRDRDTDLFTYIGLRPVTVSVILKDFLQALKKFPKLGSPEHLCAINAVAFCTAWGLFTKYRKFQWFFDQGERFYGHIHDRLTNKKARRAAPELENTVCISEANMRHVAALQAADLLAWCVNRKYQQGRTEHEWQKRLLAIERDADWFDSKQLANPNLKHMDIVHSWKLPSRRKPV